MNRTLSSLFRTCSFFARASAREYRSVLLALSVSATVCAAEPSSFNQANSDLAQHDTGRRYAAAASLKHFGPQGVGALSAALGTETDIHVKAAILDSLSTLRDPAAVPAIAPLLTTPNVFIRQRAAYALGLIGGASSEQALLKALPGEGDRFVRTTELASLSFCGSAASVSAIQENLKDKRPEVRAQAIQALRRIPAQEAKAALKAHIEKDPRLQRRINEALSETPRNGVP